MSRGQLIWPMIVELGLLDTVATAGDPDGAGPLTSGYDQDFREPVIIAPPSGSGRGTVHRIENLVKLPAQVETDTFEQLQMLATGFSPRSLIRLVFHFRDLELVGRVDAITGRPTLRMDDRLSGIYDYRTKKLIEAFPNPPGLFATQVQSRSFGLSSLKRNLLLVTFTDRALSGTGTE